jgi:hypothetical protein
MPNRGDEQERVSAGASGTPAEAPRVGDPKTDGELRRFEPVSDELVLAAIDRAERHRVGEREGAPFWMMVAHLGFVHNGWTSRRLRPQMEGLVTHGLVSRARRKGLDVWGLTDAGRERLRVARKAGAVEELPESPQHRAWRRTRSVAAERIDRFCEHAKRGTSEATVLLGSSRRVRSDVWLELANRLELVYRQLGRATYCLYEWEEPEDATADIDDYKDPGDEQLDWAARVRLFSLRSSRRNVAGLWVNEDDEDAVPTPAGVIITVPAELVGELRHGLHTVLGNAAEGVSQTTEQFGREHHPEWYAEHRERFERTWALLDLIGWREPKQPAAVQINLHEHGQAVGEALDARLPVAADDLEEADAVDAERAAQGKPPKRETTTNRVVALREFAASVKDLVGHTETPEVGNGDE